MDEVIGITTTIPVEIIFAAGLKPLDLNNVFISDPYPIRFIEIAEREGFPRNMCNWVKGIYGVVREKGIKRVIVVMVGDCSNTHALAEVLKYRGVKVIPFAYPFDRDKDSLRREIKKLMMMFGVDEESLRKVEIEMGRVRKLLKRLDHETYRSGKVTGYENHLFLVRSSDMTGDYKIYEKEVVSFLESIRKRRAVEGVRIGFVGVPPIITDIYEFVEQRGGQIVFNEIQRQFSIPYEDRDIVSRYLRYTYPYGIFPRLKDIKKEIRRREIKGLIHYVQAFCFRALEDIILRESVSVPVLTIEGELPKPLDSRTKLRIEAFLEMLKGI